MSGFIKKIWKDRVTEFPTRRSLTKQDGSVDLVTVAREEGTVSQEGDAFSAQNMNDFEERVKTAFDAVDSSLNGCSLEQEGEDFFIVGADSVRKKLGSDSELIGYSYFTLAGYSTEYGRASSQTLRFKCSGKTLIIKNAKYISYCPIFRVRFYDKNVSLISEQSVSLASSVADYSYSIPTNTEYVEIYLAQDSMMNNVVVFDSILCI